MKRSAGSTNFYPSADDELDQLIKITEKDEMSSDDITFLEELEARYEA